MVKSNEFQACIEQIEHSNAFQLKSGQTWTHYKVKVWDNWRETSDFYSDGYVKSTWIKLGQDNFHAGVRIITKPP